MPFRSRTNDFLAKSLIFVLLAAACGVSSAQKFIEPYVGVEYIHDNNYFKVSGSSEAVSVTGTSDKAEEVVVLYAGLNGEVPLSRQTIEYALKIKNSSHDRFDELDNTGYNANLNLAWNAGRVLSGDLGFRLDKSLTRFTELQRIARDMEKVDELYFKGIYHFHPDWYLVGNLAGLSIDHDERSELNREEVNAGVEVLYGSSANTRIGLSNSYGRGNYTEGVDNGYKAVNYSVVAYWESTAKSALTARMGVTERKRDERDDQDIKGTAWLVKYEWKTTAKTLLNFSVWRDIREDFEIAGFVKETGVVISPRLAITSKVSFRIDLRVTNSRYEGEAIPELGGKVREDDSTQITLAATYNVTRNIHTSLGYTRSDRDSNVNSSNYTSDAWRASAELRF